MASNRSYYSNIDNFVKDIEDFRLFNTITKAQEEALGKLAWDTYSKLVNGYTNLKKMNKVLECPADASRFILEVCGNSFNLSPKLEKFLRFYQFPLPRSSVYHHDFTVSDGNELFTIYALPDDDISIPDGDGFDIWAEVNNSCLVPADVLVLKNNFSYYKRNYMKVSAEEAKLQIEGHGFRVRDSMVKQGLYARYRIRLRYIDAPELEQEWGREAKKALMTFLKGKALTIRVYAVDEFGRYLCDVYSEDELAQRSLLSQGAAWHAPHFNPRNFHGLKEVADKAKMDKIGLWHNPKAISPWAYKKQMREKLAQSGGANSQKKCPRWLS